ncbi:MAG: hypothetical protein ACTSR8_18445 [Promethearchaeota archaeon]
MNTKKNALLIAIILSMQLSLSFIQIQYVLGKNDGDLGFNEGDKFTYTIETLDAEDYEKATGSSTSYLYEGLNYEFTIEYIVKYSDYWSVEVECLEYATEKNKQPYEMSMTIYKDGKDFNPGNYLIPKDAEDYLKDWEDNYNGSEYDVKDLQVIYDVNDTERIYEYQENGILLSIEIKYKGDTCFEYVLSSGIISFGFYYLGFLFCGIVGILFIMRKKGRRGIT